MIRQFFKDSALYGASSIIVQGIPILVLPVYVRLLSPAEYGVLEILTLFAVFINLTVALEILQGFSRHYPYASSDAERHAYASTALWFTVGAYSLFTVAALAFSTPLTSFILHEPAWETAVMAAVPATGANGIYLLLLNQLRWQLRPLSYIGASVVYVLVSVSTGICLIVMFGADVSGIFYGQMLGAVFAGGIAWFMGRSNYRFVFDRTKCCEMLRFSLPLIPSGIAVVVAVYVDRIAIQHFMTLHDVGVYSAGFRVASVVHIVLAGAYYSLTPLIYNNYCKTTTPREIARILNFLLCGTFPMLMAISLFSSEILWIFTTNAYYSAWSVVPILAAASLGTKLYVFAPGLDIAKKTGRIAMINILAALVNLALNFIFIPLWGILGAALATLISACCLLTAYLFFSQRLYPIPYHWRNIGSAGLVTASIMTMAYTLPSEMEMCSWILLSGKLLLLLIGSFFTGRYLLKRRVS